MSTPAPTLTRVSRQAVWEARIVLSNGEQLLLALILPALALVALSVSTAVDVSVPEGSSRVDVVAPGVLALAVISTSFTGQAISTAFDRRHGVLRLMATTPLGRKGLLSGRVLAVLAVQAVQIAVLGAVALVLGWSPHWAGTPLALLGVLVGTTCFTALGLVLGGTVRAEGVLAVANLLWVLFAITGVLTPPGDGLARLGLLLPSGALAEVLREALLGGPFPLVSLMVLLGWSVLAVAAATRLFRWDG